MGWLKARLILAAVVVLPKACPSYTIPLPTFRSISLPTAYTLGDATRHQVSAVRNWNELHGSDSQLQRLEVALAVIEVVAVVVVEELLPNQSILVFQILSPLR